MKLFKLIKNYKCRVFGNANIEILGLYHKDTEVKNCGLFFCLRGTKVDGTAYIKSAINNGAVAIVCEHEIPNLSGITQIVVKNARDAMSNLSCIFFGNPASKLKIIGITGTNGKTTISTMIANVFKFAGKKVALIGTNGIVFNDKKYNTEMTTPDPIELQYYFSKMVKSRCEFVVMEVSAHALDLFKVEGFRFEISVFTNLTEDHLDYFKTMDNYFEAKSKLFLQNHSKNALINVDDEYGKVLAERINIPVSTYSINEKSSYFANKIKTENEKQKFYFNNQYEFIINMAGRFNISNALAAISVLSYFNVNYQTIKNAFKVMPQIEGRFNLFDLNGVKIIIDYAHTPDGLNNLLLASREIAKDKKLIVVFGCGGNREMQKRAKMGEISSKIADFVIISTDNPRFESRENIAKQIESGMIDSNYSIELDRSKAIKQAILMASVGDVVVIAGKGAENYIEENGEKIPYSDYAEIEKFRRRKWEIIVWLLSVVFGDFYLR